MVICLQQGADLHMAQLIPLPLTVSCFSKIQIGLPFWYRLTWVVPEKGPLNDGVCVEIDLILLFLCSKHAHKISYHIMYIYFLLPVPSVLWRRWLGGRKGIRPAKTEWWVAGVIGVAICLEQGADLHMAQLMPLPLTVSCFSKIQIGFTFLVLAQPGSPGQKAIKQAWWYECVCVLLVINLPYSHCAHSMQRRTYVMSIHLSVLAWATHSTRYWMIAARYAAAVVDSSKCR